MNKIINFHDVRDSAWFENTLKLLMSKFNLVGIQDLEDFYYNDKKLKNACHITIDDGDRTFYEIIYPVLKKYKIPATLFVSPKICSESRNFWFQEIRGYDKNKFKIVISNYLNLKVEILDSFAVGIILKTMKIDDIWNIIKEYKKKFHIKDKEFQNMTIDQVKEVDKFGLVEIGAHTLNHPILANEDSKISEIEISTSIKEIESILGHDIKYFAYPNGTDDLDFGDREIETLKQSNCKLSFSTNPKNFNLKDNPLAIPRFGLSFGSSSFIKAKLFLGQYWQKLKGFKSKSERKLRIDFKRISREFL